MTGRTSRSIYFVVEGLNALACTYFFNYAFFLLRDRYGFGNRENLWLSAVHGLIYTVAAWQGGKFAQRRGYRRALLLGCLGMAATLLVAWHLPSVTAVLVAIGVWTGAMMLTWPSLEALISHDVDQDGLQHRVGVYNCVWAGASAVSYFLGGVVFDFLGSASLFWLPPILYGAMAALIWVAGPEPAATPGDGNVATGHHPEAVSETQPIPPRAFVRLAWFANPFAYVAIQTFLALVPGLAAGFQLSATQSGFLCSIWFFSRLAVFVVLWRWAGWHYRFRWLAAAFAGLVVSFVLAVLGGNLWLLVGAQVVFGAATGLIYYSSLFYSMDAGEAKGEHGGLHEAAIGVGICCGPAIGALAAQGGPGLSGSGAAAVGWVLCAGFAGLIGLRVLWGRSGAPRRAPRPG